ncbi:MAG TPA: 2-C-methyl-D-erythritol 4-phosphate cytidylyltransferase [Nitrospiraceae bacterium]|nr:2-C-methyl-D-erythritol 4-phosphate cytidylyltransferase [Nitrospiraceae bacterium]
MRAKAIAIVPSAGIGKRFGITGRKTFVELGGVPLLIHTLQKFQKADSVTEVVPVLREEDLETGLELVESYGLSKIKKIAPGGKERQDSVYNALNLIEHGDLVIVHDGVRPFVDVELIEEVIYRTKDVDNIVVGVPIRDTIKEVAEDGLVSRTMDREKLWAIQTPQAFPLNVLKLAYQKAYKENFFATDDAALVERIGGKIKIIIGSPLNIKITTQDDLILAEFLINRMSKSVK